MCGRIWTPPFCNALAQEAKPQAVRAAIDNRLVKAFSLHLFWEVAILRTRLDFVINCVAAPRVIKFTGRTLLLKYPLGGFPYCQRELV
jgi:hypothetical protein